MEKMISYERDGKLVVELVFDLTGESMLDIEEGIQDVLNSAGQIASASVLSKFDTDGQPIVVDRVRYTSKGVQKKK
jgi:hypothetical protein